MLSIVPKNLSYFMSGYRFLDPLDRRNRHPCELRYLSDRVLALPEMSERFRLRTVLRTRASAESFAIYPVKSKVLKYSNLALSGSVKLPTLICLMY